jgi:hypothetical protein
MSHQFSRLLRFMIFFHCPNRTNIFDESSNRRLIDSSLAYDTSKSSARQMYSTKIACICHSNVLLHFVVKTATCHSLAFRHRLFTTVFTFAGQRPVANVLADRTAGQELGSSYDSFSCNVNGHEGISWRSDRCQRAKTIHYNKSTIAYIHCEL